MNRLNHCNPKCIVYERTHFRAGPEPEGWLRIVFQSLDDIMKLPIKRSRVNDERCTISQCDIYKEDLGILIDYLNSHAAHSDTIEEAVIECFYEWGESEDWFQYDRFKSVCEELDIHPNFKQMSTVRIHPLTESDVESLKKILADNHFRYMDGEYNPVFSRYLGSYFPVELDLMKRTAKEFVSNITCLAAHATMTQNLHVEELPHFYLRGSRAIHRQP